MRGEARGNHPLLHCATPPPVYGRERVPSTTLPAWRDRHAKTGQKWQFGGSVSPVKCRAIARTTHPVGPCGRTAPAILLRVGRGTLGVGPAWGLEANTAETASAQRIISRAAATIMWKRPGGRMTTGPSPRRPEATRLGTPKLPPSVPRTREAVPPPTLSLLSRWAVTRSPEPFGGTARVWAHMPPFAPTTTRLAYFGAILPPRGTPPGSGAC